MRTALIATVAKRESILNANLITESEDFTAWDKLSVTLSGGVSDPDGNTDAFTVTQAGDNAFPRISRLVSEAFQNDTVTFSMHAKDGGAAETALQVAGTTSGTNGRQNFSWSGGVPSVGNTNFGANFTKVDAGVVDEGGGWYRLWVAMAVGATEEASVTVRAYPVWNTLVTNATVMYGAQLETASSPTAYEPTTV